MADNVRVTIEGLPELKRKFSELSGRGQRAALSTAMRKGGNVVRDDARRRASFSRRVAKGIIVKTKVKRTSAEARIGFSGAGWFGAPWEKGWIAAPRSGKGAIRRATARHVPARPMLRPALDEKQQEVLQAFADALNEAIDKVKARGL